MSDLAIPYIAGSAGPGDYLEAPSGQASGSELERGQFCKLDAGDNDLIVCAGDENDDNIFGICHKDERNGIALVYTGKDVKVPIADGATTPAFGEEVYLASATTVTGPTEATNGQKAIGLALEVVGGGLAILTHWLRDRTPADKS